MVATGCSLRKRATETPVPNEQNFNKEFFFEKGDTSKPKRFIFGKATTQVDTIAEKGGALYLTQLNLHENIEFKLTYDYLIGYRVNPSLPNNRERWIPVLRIKISKHFYNEMRKDEYGRDTKEFIENDQRSDWTRRPMMKLDLTNITYEENAVRASSLKREILTLAADEIERDDKNSFLGFNINEKVTWSFGRNNNSSTTMGITSRINLLAFKPDYNFKGTAYHVSNADYFNILHTVSRQIEDGGGVDRQVMKAAKWDFSKPLDIYLNNVPEKYTQVFIDAVNEWDLMLQNIKAVPEGQKAFRVHTTYPGKYTFDLRYPTLNWVEDTRISAHGPLGIALNNADLETGKMIGANVVIYGGKLEAFLNRYPVSSGSSKFSKIVNTVEMAAFPFVPFNFGGGPSNIPLLQQSLNDIRFDLLPSAPSVAMFDAATTNFTLNTDFESLLDTQFFEHTSDLNTLQEPLTFEQALQQEHYQQLKSNSLESGFFVSHHDRTFADMVPQLSAAMGTIISSSDRENVKRSVIKNVLLHELGHFLGLGHQFKGSILPEEGTLPTIYTDSVRNANKAESLYARSRAATGKTNYTSIMDYPSGFVEVAIKEKDVKPGPHDELVLRYIYKGEISLYDKANDKFNFEFTLDKINQQYAGQIPPTVNGMKVAYFPACNDWDATLMRDSECKRWDDGITPAEIVESQFRMVRDNISSILFNFSNRSNQSAEEAESRLWGTALGMFSNVRTFYDDLRIHLAETIYEGNLTQWEALRGDNDALFNFSRACVQNTANIQNAVLKKIMRDKKVRKLCKANIAVLNQTRSFISLPMFDHTDVSFSTSMQGGFIGGEGSNNSSKYFSGTFTGLTNYPLKMAALYNMTSPNPYMLYNGYFMNNLFFDKSEYRFLYRTLFPHEVTEIMSLAVTKNMAFGSNENSASGETTLGKTVLSLAYLNSIMNSGNYSGNETARPTDDYNRILQTQARFDFKSVAIMITTVEPTEGDKERIKQFKFDLLDLRTMKTAPIQDVYIMPGGRIIARDKGKFLFPLSEIRFINDSTAFVMAYQIEYDEPALEDKLFEESTKALLTSEHSKIVDDCIDGINSSGLSKFFTGATRDDLTPEEQFVGFHIQLGISTELNSTKRDQFKASIQQEYNKYEAYARAKNPKLNVQNTMTRRCEEAVRGVGMISSAAALLNGYWLGITNNYIKR